MKLKTKELIGEIIFWISLFILLSFIIILISLPRVSALYVGETYSNDFVDNILNCSVDNNLNISWNNSIAYVTIDSDYNLSYFTITCWTEGYTNPVVHHHSSRGSSNSIIYTTNSTNKTITPNNLVKIYDLPEIIDLTKDTDINDIKQIEKSNYFGWIGGIIIGILILAIIIFLRGYDYEKEPKLKEDIKVNETKEEDKQ